jgi:uncharacterized repeat protein (TIGR01451 family)
MSTIDPRTLKIFIPLGLLFALVALLQMPAPVQAAETGAPQWTVASVSRPTNFAPGDQSGEDAYVVTVTNTGGASSDGSPITVSDELPEGLTLAAKGASGIDQRLANRKELGDDLTCTFANCTYTGVVVPDDTLVVRFPVDVSASLPPASCAVPAGAMGCVKNVVRVNGGGASDGFMETPTVISQTAAGFGISPGGSTTALSSTQAGAHPDVTTSIAFNTVDAGGALAGDVKDTIDELPVGFASDFVDTPSCLEIEFAQTACPVPTQVGVVTLSLYQIGVGVNGGHRINTLYIEPVYNLAPGPGEVARIGFTVPGISSFTGGFTLRPGDYGANVTFADAYEGVAELDNVSLTVWGVPADPSHDPWRSKVFSTVSGAFGETSDAAVVPFVSNPTLCTSEPLEAVFRVDSWEQPESYASAGMPFGPIDGCDRLGMEPAITAEPTTTQVSAATGLVLNMKIPQTYENAYGLATANLNRAVVTLPEGITVNPSAGAGLAACSESQYKEEEAPEGAPPGGGCPNESKLGTVKIKTPAVSEEATGSVFLASPAPNGEAGRNPFNSLLALYIVARIPDRGIVVRAAGEVRADPVTGRLVTTFPDLPPLPFSTFTFQFRQGATSPLVTPPACGDYEVTAALTPWSALEDPPLTPLIPPFEITHGLGGGACPSGGVPSFEPQVISGADNNDAGSYSPFYLRIERQDAEQEITRFSTVLPPGLTGNLTGIPFCSETAIQAAKEASGAQEEADPSCPAASEVGHTIVEAGVGSVLAQTPGKIYLAGPYHGAPLSIVSITSAKVGPFDLGTVVIRFALDINPTTAQVEVSANGSDPIPHIIKGIVVHVRDIRVYINRPNFILDPTNCDPLSISNTIEGAQGANVSVTTPFTAADCSSLAFKPTFAVSTSAKTSRADGASLAVKLTVPGALGTQANISRVKVELPEQLPSRLPTLQKACLAAQFETNPAGCPPASIIGHAKAITPILPVPLEGPAYFVSHGGEGWPSLVVVLQGYGFTIDLTGTTFISKAGVTSTTFKTVPDQPVTSFELTLPEGPYSALTALGNLCSATTTATVKKKVTVKIHGRRKTITRKVKKAEPTTLQMPTEFVAQNGAEIHQDTPVTVTGCLKKAVHAKSTKHRVKGGKKRAK